MKLIRCHIENFGKLHDFNYDFNEGLNVFMEENGWGKSTLTAFIRAMFYGFSGETKRDGITNERKRYAPWQGGAFGGNLVFEAKGKKYLVSRNFGAKQQFDTYELRYADTNTVCDDYSERLGEELFQINCDSFMRTVFIGQNECAKAGISGDINAKLGNITDSIDLNRYENADEELNNALNKLSPSKKGGMIYTLKSNASEIKARIQNAAGCERTIDEIETRISDKRVSIEKDSEERRILENRKLKAARIEKKRSLRKTYEDLVAENAEKEALLTDKRAYFPGILPTKDEVLAWKNAAVKYNGCVAGSLSAALSATDTELMKDLSGTFFAEIPNESELDLLVNEANELINYRTVSRKYALDDNDEAKLVLYGKAFSDDENAADKISDIANDWNECIRLKSSVENKENEISDLEFRIEEEGRKGIGPKVLRLVLAIVACVLGVVAFFFAGELTKAGLSLPWRPISYAIFGIAAILLLSVIFSKAGKGREKEMLEAQACRLREEVEKMESNIEDIDIRVHELLANNGIDCPDENVPIALRQLFKEAFEYKGLLERKNSQDAGKEEYFKEVSARIDGYLTAFGIAASESEYQAKLAELKAQAKHYQFLKAKADESARNKHEADSIKAMLADSLSIYSFNLPFDISAGIEEIDEKLDEYIKYKSLKDDAGRRLALFISENDMDELLKPESGEETLTVEELQELESETDRRIAAARDGLNTDMRSLDLYQETFENLLIDREELKTTEEDIAELTETLNIAKKTREMLGKAKENLTAKYMEPLLSGFIKYYSEVSGHTADSFKIDSSATITREEAGLQRSLECLSVGWQDLSGFCARLSAVDAMYKEERPFLVLDDPFVNLDDVNLEGAKKLLSEVADKYQVLYVTCRTERQV